MSKKLKIKSLNPGSMSIRDVRDLMKFTGEPDLEKVFAPLEQGANSPESLETIAYIIYLMERAVTKNFTLDDALDLPLTVIQELGESAGKAQDEESDQTGESSS